jgi:hypothetical protein
MVMLQKWHIYVSSHKRPVAFESLRTIRISDTANGPPFPMPSKR